MRRARLIPLFAIALAALGVGLAWVRYTSAESRLDRGRTAIRDSDWSAVEEYARLLERAGHEDHSHLLLGESHRARRRPDLALAEFNRIQDTGAIRLEGATQAGFCLLELKQHAEATRVFEFVVTEAPENVEARRGLAAALYDLGQTVRCVEQLEIVARLDPADARPHRLMGLVYKDSVQFELAVAAYQEALARGPSESVADEIRLELAEVLLRLNRFSEALETLGERGRVLRAEALRGLGRGREAAELLDAKPEPTSEWRRLRGQLHLDDARHGDAIPLLERAAAGGPADHQSQLLLAQAYAAAGRLDDAKRAAARAENIRKDLDAMTELSREANAKPWDPVVRLQLAEIADRIGKPQLAELWRSAAASCRARRK